MLATREEGQARDKHAESCTGQFNLFESLSGLPK